MDREEFRKYGKLMIDYICDYSENIERRDVTPSVDPGYLKKLIPDEAPTEGERYEDILQDFEEKVMPGVVHWNHPKFFAYYPSCSSFPSLLADMVTNAMGSLGFSWASCPASTELETIVLNWYAKALGLPKAFISDTPGSIGGGVLQGCASECILVCMIAARSRTIQCLKGNNTECHDNVFLPQLIAYASKEAHSSIEKAAKITLVKLRIIDVDARGRLRVDLLRQAIQNDLNDGLKPFYVVATLGTTGACAFDNITEIGKVCQEVPSIWFHVDGAYAGNAFILPEMRKFSEGLEYADSFNASPSKLLLVNFESPAMWVKDVQALKTAMNVNPLYLRHEYDQTIDYRHHGIALGRRFRALKLWFVFRSYGISGLQKFIQNHIDLAKKFEMMVREDDRFEVTNDVYVGLVCFKLRASDQINEELLDLINHSRKMYMTPCMFNGKYAIRFCVAYEHATEQHIIDAWVKIQDYASVVLREDKLKPLVRQPISRTKNKSIENTSFVSRISGEIDKNHVEHLRDGSAPISVLDSDVSAQSLHTIPENPAKIKETIDRT